MSGPGINSVLIGPPGSKRTVQASRLAKHYSVCHLNAGKVLRTLIASGLADNVVKQRVSNGEYVKDDLMVDVMWDELNSPECLNGFLLDGFPRTRRQAELFDKLLKQKGKKIKAAVELGSPSSKLQLNGEPSDSKQRSMTNYHAHLLPLTNYYKSTGVHSFVDYSQPADEVFQSICSAFDRLKKRGDRPSYWEAMTWRNFKSSYNMEDRKAL